jgi:hypothetical protein
MRTQFTILRRGLLVLSRSFRKVRGEPVSHEADWPKILEWAEKQGSESLKARFATAEIIAKESQTTLTVLLAGVGGSAAYAAKLFDSRAGTATTWAFAIVCGYLIVLSVILIMRCMRFESYPALYQTPENILQPNFSLDALREAELGNLTERIREATAINNRRAAALNRVRIAAALGPLVFLIAAICAMPGVPPQAAAVTITCTQPTPSAASAATTGLTCKLTQ